MQLTYVLTLNDYKAALRLHANQTVGRRVARFGAGMGLPGIGLLVLAMNVFLAFTQQDYLSRNQPGLLIVPLIFLLIPVIQANLVRKQFKQSFPEAARSLSLDIDDERIICTNPGSSETKFSWSTIVAFAQDEKVTMLNISKLRFLFFPTSALAPVQRAEFNDLVARHVASRKP